ncbi:Fructosamine kinase-domain-containing protein [Penicillium malachiteum]|nr:Fructosamine kinase-domain-containing protein [Penicillium malachiteum]
MADTSEKWASGVQGIFKLHMAVVQAMPSGTRVISANPWGVSAWTKTAKVSVILSDGTPKKYFLKCATGREARPLTEGEYHSATAIHSVVPGFVPKPCGWGRYWDGESLVYFFLGDFYDMEIQKVPDPESVATIDGELVPEPELFAAKVAELHTKGNLLRRTVKWEASWAKCFTNQLQDVIKYDNETNGIWPELDAACEQVINAVIPRLLGVLQSDGRSIEPVLIHGDLWEQNVGIDKETGQTIVFDPGCTYAHNEMDFGTWRCSWARQFRVPIYMELYQQHIKPSDPQNEWDDRNRLYSLHPYLNDSAGHPGSTSRSM